jgi:hypothetical protein
MIWRGYGEMVLDAGTVEVQPAIIFFCTGGELIINCTTTRNKKTMADSNSLESRSYQLGQQWAAVGGGS